MLRHITVRILWIIPTLWLISIVAFGLSVLTPNDSVDLHLELEGVSYDDDQIGVDAYYAAYEEKRLALHKDKPIFYLSLQPNHYLSHNDLEQMNVHQRRAAKQMQRNGYEKEAILSYLTKLAVVKNKIKLLPDSIVAQYQPSIKKFNMAHHSADNLSDMRRDMINLANDLQDESIIEDITTAITSIPADRNSRWHYPTLKWNGTKNQYHIWLKNILKGDFGISILDGQKVSSKIAVALKWTALLVLLNLIVALLISIPLSVISAYYHNTRIDHWISYFSLSIYSIPIFWLATLMIVFLTTDTYGSFFNIFSTPSSFFTRADDSIWELLSKYAGRLLLPVLCLSIKDVATLTRIIRADLVAEQDKDYVRTLRAKGVSNWQVMWRHVLPNALIGLTTLIVNNIPKALAGTLIIEVIFNIPGMGRLMYSSIFSSDWNIVFGVLILIGLITTLFYILGDILYSWLNPKVKYA